MDNSLLVQYLIIAVIVVIAAYSLFKVIAKNFSSNKFKKKGKPGCDSDCCG
ncbi:hypothetical protein [Kaistella antarctica]|uniref:FeoB-associated Cys-rich membrane protein n=1 Tax=Kaistella antarctica TaxID=266748 RepID=A0A448NSZ0_9FLAO|nr:hypothetical protein [Kaistella antarctica]SEV82060.1 hypothetical protein SAMN05421765_0333 [Kaistella antarctica]VEI00498.1 Uncharacterised protein [Kaistella antarctica]